MFRNIHLRYVAKQFQHIILRHSVKNTILVLHFPFVQHFRNSRDFANLEKQGVRKKST